MAYIYNVDIFCDDCGEDICRQITEEGHAPADPEDQGSYDSDEFPKYVDGTAEYTVSLIRIRNTGTTGLSRVVGLCGPSMPHR